MLKQKELREFVKSTVLRRSQLIGYEPSWADNCQYVIGDIEEEGLCLLYSSSPPQVDSIDETRAKFLVFSSMANNLNSLASVIHHSSLHHESVLKVFALSDFNLIP